MIDTGVVILCHGSRGAKAVKEIPDIMDRIVREVTTMLPPGIHVEWAALQFNRPDLDAAVKTLVDAGVKRVIVMPYFLFSGNHITEDIPEAIDALKKIYPEQLFVMTKPMGMESTFPSYIAQRIKSAVPDLSPALDPGKEPISPIETESMQIIDSLLPDLTGFSDNDISVIKRIVHATGDPKIASSIRIHKDAVDSGIEALVKGQPIYTDVRMVQAGISRGSLSRLGNPVYCILDEEPQKKLEGRTRSASAVLSMGERLSGSIVAIGNAPTALFALLELIDRGIKPALVVGIPVGFVQAKESKDALTGYAIPYVTITGRRGGSPSAAATINALMRLALEENS